MIRVSFFCSNLQSLGESFDPAVTFDTFSSPAQSRVTVARPAPIGVRVCVTVPRIALCLVSSVISARMCLTSKVRMRSVFFGVSGLANGLCSSEASPPPPRRRPFCALAVSATRMTSKSANTGWRKPKRVRSEALRENMRNVPFSFWDRAGPSCRDPLYRTTQPL